jgi:hypothetical protein
MTEITWKGPYEVLPCTIVYRHNGRVRRWTVSACWERDNEVTLKRHLGRWIKDAEFIKIRWRAKSSTGD